MLVTIYKDLRLVVVMMMLMVLLIWHWFSTVRGHFTGLVDGDGGRSGDRRNLVGLFLRIVVTIVCDRLMLLLLLLLFLEIQEFYRYRRRWFVELGWRDMGYCYR